MNLAVSNLSYTHPDLPGIELRRIYREGKPDYMAVYVNGELESELPDGIYGEDEATMFFLGRLSHKDF